LSAKNARNGKSLVAFSMETPGLNAKAPRSVRRRRVCSERYAWDLTECERRDKIGLGIFNEGRRFGDGKNRRFLGSDPGAFGKSDGIFQNVTAVQGK